jgi:hypothetical protein
MAVPHFLSTGFRFFERTNVSDVQTIIDDFEDEVLTATDLPKDWHAWTGSAGTYTAPTYEGGKFFKVILTRVTQQKLSIEVRDQNNLSVCIRRINCPSTNNWTVRIFTGPCHCVIDVTMFSAQPEALYAGVLDLTPEAQNAHEHFVYGGGYRTAADAAETGSNSCWHCAHMVDDTTAQPSNRASLFTGRSSGAASGSKTLSGARVYRPRELWAQVTGAGGIYNYFHYAGKCYQQLLVTDALAKGARFWVPIDAGVLAEFMVAGGVAPYNGWQLCVRCG